MAKLNGLNFKPSVVQLTQKRVEMIMQYIIYCYEKMVIDKKTYSKTKSLSKSGKQYRLEEYLTKRLVVEYLSDWSSLKFYKSNISNIDNVHIYFSTEGTDIYDENSEDYIDIQIFETKLSELLGEELEKQVHFAVECKVIKEGYSGYVNDIKKMTSRPYDNIRLPFEGQIGYILNSQYTPESVKDEINKSLKNQTRIQTTQELKKITLTPSFEASYQSKHKKNYDNSDFTIYHLFLEYNNIVVP